MNVRLQLASGKAELLGLRDQTNRTLVAMNEHHEYRPLRVYHDLSSTPPPIRLGPNVSGHRNLLFFWQQPKAVLQKQLLAFN